MKFQFNVNSNDQDYFDFNLFVALRSPEGKKKRNFYRIEVAVICAVYILFLLYRDYSTVDFLVSVIAAIIALAVVWIVFELSYPSTIRFLYKRSFRRWKKEGKLLYSPSSVVAFYEDSFVETGSNYKTEQNYSSIKRISVVDNKAVYIHLNDVFAVLLPFRTFESKEQYDSFLEFIKTKCAEIDMYY